MPSERRTFTNFNAEIRRIVRKNAREGFQSASCRRPVPASLSGAPDHILKHFTAQSHILDKAFVRDLSIATGSFMTLMAVRPVLCPVNLKLRSVQLDCSAFWPWGAGDVRGGSV